MKFFKATSYKNLVFKCILSTFLLNLGFGPISHIHYIMNFDYEFSHDTYIICALCAHLIVSLILGVHIRKTNKELLLDNVSKRKNYVRHILIFMVFTFCPSSVILDGFFWIPHSIGFWLERFAGINIENFRFLNILMYQIFSSIAFIPTIFICLLTVFCYKPSKKQVKCA